MNNKSQKKNILTNLTYFFRNKLWKKYEQTSGLNRFFFSVTQRLVILFRCFTKSNLNNHVLSLTYSTLFSVVPLLAIIFAIAKGFGLENFISRRINEAFVGQQEVANILIGFVKSYLVNTKNGIFVGFGVLLLFFTLGSLTAKIESTFNTIWHVKKERTPLRKVTDYSTLILLLPCSMILTSGFSIFVNSLLYKLVNDELPGFLFNFLFEFLPFIIISIMFTGFYIFMPNTYVKFKSALVGGIPAGIAFQLLQMFYVHSQLWVSSYNAIYGSFAALPLFMLWCQISWLICIIGALLTYVDQNMDKFYMGNIHVRVGTSIYSFCALLLMSEICKRFSHGTKQLTLEGYSKKLMIPYKIVNSIVLQLSQAQLLIETESQNGEIEYQPTRNTETILIKDVLWALSESGNYCEADIEAVNREKWNKFKQMENDLQKNEFCKTQIQDF